MTIRKPRGRPPLDKPLVAVTLRLDQRVIDSYKAKYGANWRREMARVVTEAAYHEPLPE